MQKRIVLSLLCVMGFTALNAQVTIDDFVPGKIVLSNGDTLNVRIKPDREDRLSRQVQVWDSQSNGAKRYQPKDLKYYTFDKAEYFTLKDEEGKSVFMEANVKGEASLYGYTYREESGKKEVVTDFYIKKIGGGLIKVPTQPGRFKTDMAVYFADYPQLAEKIENKQYGYYDMEAVTEEYNAWVKAGKPKNRPAIAQGEDKEDGPKLVRNKPVEEKGSRVGLDLPFFATYNFVSSPSALNSLYTTKTIGFGFDLGVGARIRLIRGLNMRLGVNFRDKGMRVTSNSLAIQVQDQNGNVFNDVLTLNEKGRIYYPGIYMNLGQEWSHFHVGGGFNLSFYSFYRGDYTITSQNFPAQLNESVENSKGSFIVHKLTDAEGRGKNFNAQFDVHFSVGGRFKIGDNVILKPTISYSVPMVALYNSGISVQGSLSSTELNVSGYQLKFGLITDIGFK